MRFIFPALFIAAPALADPEPYPQHMMDWGYGWGHGLFIGPLFWLITLALIIAGVIWFARSDFTGLGKNSSSALAELDLRFARGEIDAEEYASRKKLLTK